MRVSVLQSSLPHRAHRELRALDGLGAALMHDGAIPEHAERQPRLQGAAGDAAAGHDPAAGFPVIWRAAFSTYCLDASCKPPICLSRWLEGLHFYAGMTLLAVRQTSPR